MQLTLPTTVRGFHDYYKLTASPRDLTEAFGYVFEAETLSLSQASEELSWCRALQNKLSYAVSHLSFESEMMRREFLIAPVLFDVAQYLGADLRSEYGIRVSEQLKGSLDYYVRAQQNICVVEAKQGDLSRGFSQLCAELIAVDQQGEITSDVLYGAVSFGDLWRFGRLVRSEKRITQDIGILGVPVDTEKLVRVLIAILRGES
ncbi:hypothetical protein [Armatimonas sp.]|uniref:hypothetical protein n=1 Tax=Armatimonas sp. TaxID=1872638 RepID=UPI003753A568